MECNGICKSGIFYFFKDISHGPPKQTCSSGLKKLFKEETVNVGIALLISFVVTFAAFVAQYGLWGSTKKE